MKGRAAVAARTAKHRLHHEMRSEPLLLQARPRQLCRPRVFTTRERASSERAGTCSPLGHQHCELLSAHFPTGRSWQWPGANGQQGTDVATDWGMPVYKVRLQRARVSFLGFHLRARAPGPLHAEVTSA